MQQYLFRGKRKDNGEWVCGCLVSTSTDEAFILIGVTGHIKRDDYEVYMAEVVPETVGMWTGMVDKDCKKLFKDDIISTDGGWTLAVEWNNTKGTAALGFYYQGTKGFTCMLTPHESGVEDFIKIIGNIHDNPELVNPTAQEQL